LPGVQIVERAYRRVPANDLSRARIGVATNSTTPTNHLGLTGEGVLVGVNEFGVDATHPDLSGRVFGAAADLIDLSGHGTHVAAIIAGSGEASTNVLNARGSVNPGTNGQYRGIAPAAQLYVQDLNLPDETLQESAVLNGTFISHNSWNYIGSGSYSLAAASFDAAVRDALPGQQGSQAVMFVFPTGNSGDGSDSGLSGTAGSVLSPATAKNVLSVGAVELPRDITNVVEKISNGFTNTSTPWRGATSSGNQVASFSGRGNVGVRVEGDFGRVKPDVVAPGTFVISARSSQWDEDEYYNPTNYFYAAISGQVVTNNGFNVYGIFLPENAVGFTIELEPNIDSPVPFPSLPIYVRRDGEPTLTDFELRRNNSISVPPDLGGVGTSVGQLWFYGIANPGNQPVNFDIFTTVIVTNDLGNYYEVLKELNDSISGTNEDRQHYYRYESGTSMAAAAASGTLALMQEFFEQRLGVTNSPALMKALLINGARSVGALYDFNPRRSINYQGWGLIRLENSLPAGISNAFNLSPGSKGAIKLIDQSPTNALATGESHTRIINLSEEGQSFPLRVTLAWTDPPGNPAAGIKLVNDLDLIITNLQTGDVYLGNDIPASSVYNFIWDTNQPPNFDAVNNVENIYLEPALGSNYSITVVARRVNVNAVTAHPNNVVQDYALVISSGNGEADNAIEVGTINPIAGARAANIIFTTNTIEQVDFSATFIENQRVGANTPLLGTTNGITNQWTFYVVTNTTEFTNAAFLISQQTEQAVPRMGVRTSRSREATRQYADLDLYVSTNSALLNLDPVAVDTAFKSRSRNELSGDELLIFTDSEKDQVYYVGVKSEDQMGGEYEFFALFTLLPLGQEDANGFIRAYPMHGYTIPDGTPADPGGTRFLAVPFPGLNETVRRVVITNNVSHENYGDVIATVDHNSRAVVFDNHRSLETPPYPVPPGPYEFLYDDSGEGDFANAILPDGPGTFASFIGEEPGGPWYFTYSDDALTQVGMVSNVMIRVDRQCENDCIMTNTIGPNSWRYFSRNVPVGATNLTVCINVISPNPQPLLLFIRKNELPTTNVFEFTMTINGSGCLTIDKSTLPPLQSGRYFIGIFNPNPTQQTFSYQATVAIGAPPTPMLFNGNTGSVPILDDAVTNYTQFITNVGTIAQLDVGLRIDHPRISDLAVTLISPRGTRVLLVENRGGPDANAFGSSLTITNIAPATSSGGPESVTKVVDTGVTFGSIEIDYNFFCQPDRMLVLYEGATIFDTGLINNGCPSEQSVPRREKVFFGPGASTEVTIVMNPPGFDYGTNTLWEYTVSSINQIHNYLVFTDNTNFTTTPIKFAAPPFTGAAGSTVTLSDFESPVTAQTYTAPTIGNPDGWNVLTNSVQVVNDPSFAYAGNQYLSLLQGSIARTISLNADRDYSLSYAVRGSPRCLQFTNFASTQGLTLTDNATVISGGILQLTPSQTSRHGAAWSKTKLPVNDGFDTTFQFRIAGPFIGGGGDGIAFTIQNISPTADAFSAIGGSRGNAISVFFNTFMNWPGCASPVTCDLYSNSIGIGINDQYVIQTDLTPFGIELKDGNIHEARVIYGAEGITVILDGSVVLANVPLPGPGLSPGVDSCGYAWVGFEAFCGATAETHEILNWNFCSATPAPSGTITLAGIATNQFIVGDEWTTRSLAFRANQPSVDLAVQPGQCDLEVYMDAFRLVETAGSRYVLPEESLKVLEGENAFGEWQLEILDSRTGAFNNVALLDWQLQFIFQDEVPLPPPLAPGVPQTNTICAGQIQYYVIDVPPWARFATNELLSATGPVNVYFNQFIRPTGLNIVPPDYDLLIGQTSGVAVLATNVPPLQPDYPVLIPGQRYYIGIENPSATDCVTVAFLVDFDLVTFPQVTELTNQIPLCTVNSGPAGAADYYYFNVSPNAVRAQFELFNLSGDMTLVLRRGLPPTLGIFDYISANVFTNDEVITVFDFSQPVPLTPGDWYFAAVNVSGPSVSYCAQASEWPVYGTNIVITNMFIGTNSLCLTWTSLPGMRYFVEGVTNLTSTNWATVSDAIVATDYATTYCVPFPSPFQFFRVREGGEIGTYIPPPIISSIRRTFRGVEITWGGPVTARYQVEWTDSLFPTNWQPFTVPPEVTSTTGLFQFIDDGSEAGPLDGLRYYRLVVVP